MPDAVHDLDPLAGEHVLEADLGDLGADGGIELAAEHLAEVGKGHRAAAEFERVDDAEAGEGVDVDPLLVGENDLLHRRVEIEDAIVVVGDVLNERELKFKSRLAFEPDRIAELKDERLLGLADDEQRARRDHQGDQGDAAQNNENQAVHFGTPSAAGAGCSVRRRNSGNGR
jgi:hypothetical protein